MSIDFASWAVSIVTALAAGCVLFLVASGLTMVFGVLRILNFAHASLMLLGAYAASSIIAGQNTLGRYAISLLIVPFLVAGVGIVIEVVVLRRVYDRPHLTQLLVTFSFVFIIWGSIEQLWGARFRSVPQPEYFNESIRILGRAVPQYFIVPFIVTLGVFGILWYLMKRSRFGREMRASASNREVADIAGIDSSRIFTKVFALGAWLAGVAGVLIAPMQVLTPTTDQAFILQAFIVIVIGGMGSLAGSVVGALAVAFSNAVGVQLVPRLTAAVPFILMGIVLLVRPEGIFGKKDREV